jgi:hypothetical protein
MACAPRHGVARDFRNEVYVTFDTKKPDQFGLRPPNFTTLAHFSVSSAMRLPKSAGAPASTVPSRSTSRAFDLGIGEARIDLLVELIDEANSWEHRFPPRSSRHSPTGSRLGSGYRAAPASASWSSPQCTQLAGPNVLDRPWDRSEEDMHLPSEQVCTSTRYGICPPFNKVTASSPDTAKAGS